MEGYALENSQTAWHLIYAFAACAFSVVFIAWRATEPRNSTQLPQASVKPKGQPPSAANGCLQLPLTSTICKVPAPVPSHGKADPTEEDGDNDALAEARRLFIASYGTGSDGRALYNSAVEDKRAKEYPQLGSSVYLDHAGAAVGAGGWAAVGAPLIPPQCSSRCRGATQCILS